MSLERELLTRAVMSLDSEYSNELMDEIKELLAQPEQEPVVWMYNRKESEEKYSTHFRLGKKPPSMCKFSMIGYNLAVRDLKKKVDSVFNLIMEEDDESDT